MDLCTPTLILVRHSERLDEADETAWKALLSGRSGGKGTAAASFRSHRSKSFASDPPITDGSGVRYAMEAAETLSRMIRERLGDAASSKDGGASDARSERGFDRVVVFSSRMVRAVQTAYHIARALDAPVHLNSGLATIINSVQRMKGGFEFASDEELSYLCTKHGSASATRSKGSSASNHARSAPAKAKAKASAAVATSPTFVDADSSESEWALPADSWRGALRRIAQLSIERRALCVVVAHRETIRKLAGRHLVTPYCCIAFFHIADASAAAASADAVHDAVDECDDTASDNEDAMDMRKISSFLSAAKESREGEPSKSSSRSSSGVYCNNGSSSKSNGGDRGKTAAAIDAKAERSIQGAAESDAADATAPEKLPPAAGSAVTSTTTTTAAVAATSTVAVSCFQLVGIISRTAEHVQQKGDKL